MLLIEPPLCKDAPLESAITDNKSDITLNASSLAITGEPRQVDLVEFAAKSLKNFGISEERLKVKA
ncbi:hypothetical protein FVEN_g12623 [Fusarium venenatum]|nr:hypothetical protein FVEN_g12623 [Fusarium venenatum]